MRFHVKYTVSEEYEADMKADSEADAKQQLSWRYPGRKVSASSVVEISDEDAFEACIPKGAREWELYTSEPKSNLAATSLSKSMRTCLQRILKAKEAGRSVLTEVRKQREVMSKRMERWSDAGATDSEPRSVVDDCFARFGRTILGRNLRFSFGELEKE